MPVISADEFAQLAERYRPELRAYCYRIAGSIEESEDLVQDTYLRAWQNLDRFEGRSSLRLWLYRIATTTCLNALETRNRRPLPSGLASPSETAAVRLGAAEPDVPWLQPAPDSLLHAATDDPAIVAAHRSSVRLAFIAALQHLSARQRAVLVLHDVLGWKAKEVAEILDASTATVNSALQRARADLAQVQPREDEVDEPPEPEMRELLDHYMSAFIHADVAALAELLRADVELEMPPIPTWFVGRDAVCGFLGEAVVDAPDQWRMIPTRANGALALAMYKRADDGRFHAHGLDVLSISDGRIARIVAFMDPAIVAAFGIPDIFPSPSAPDIGTPT